MAMAEADLSLAGAEADRLFAAVRAATDLLRAYGLLRRLLDTLGREVALRKTCVWLRLEETRKEPGS